MIKFIESIILFSENAKNLAKFYQEKVGLKVTLEGEMGEKGETKIYDFDFPQGASLYIVDHSNVKGKNKNPERVMFNLEVDDIEKEVKRFRKAGIKETQDIHHVEDYGYIATFEDLDGNFFQLVKTRP